MFFTRREMRGGRKVLDERQTSRSSPFSPSQGEKVAEGRMMGCSSDRIVQAAPLTLALSPRFVVSILRDSLAGERGQSEVTLPTTF